MQTLFDKLSWDHRAQSSPTMSATVGTVTSTIHVRDGMFVAWSLTTGETPARRSYAEAFADLLAGGK